MSHGEYQREGYQLIAATGVLDGHTPEASALEATILQACEAPRGDYVVDLSRVEYINSSMLGLLVRLLYALQGDGKRLILLSPPPAVENVLRLTGLAELMPVVESEDAAREQLGVPPAGPGETAEPIDYSALTEEIEEIMSRGDEDTARRQRRTGQLRKLLGG
jgi:anti-anti-sigma factor